MNGVPIIAYLALGLVLFCIGAVGVVVRRSPIVIFMCIELMLNAVNLTFLTFAKYLPTLLPNNLNDQATAAVTGEMMVIFVMAVAAAEVAVGLGIMMAIFRLRDQVDVDSLNAMRG
ncbi:MAG: NADH-quinone oxidoreductase subunit NuoK [Acidocella sp.]|nr:NADH-quinone oxidoreductase subunit NuoK [Acidocella sp.]